MDREEAIALFREITNNCNINVTSVNLVPPRTNDILSKGYQLHIKSLMDNCERGIIQKIVANHHLALKEIEEKIIIYKPQSP